MPSVLWCCWLGGRKLRHPTCKKLEWWDDGMIICLKWGADLYMAQLMPLPFIVSCFSKIQIGSTFLVPVYLGSPGKRATNWRPPTWILTTVDNKCTVQTCKTALCKIHDVVSEFSTRTQTTYNEHTSVLGKYRHLLHKPMINVNIYLPTR